MKKRIVRLLHKIILKLDPYFDAESYELELIERLPARELTLLEKAWRDQYNQQLTERRFSNPWSHFEGDK